MTELQGLHDPKPPSLDCESLWKSPRLEYVMAMQKIEIREAAARRVQY